MHSCHEIFAEKWYHDIIFFNRLSLLMFFQYSCSDSSQSVTQMAAIPTDSSREKAFLDACQSGDILRMQDLLDQGVSIHVSKISSFSPLHHAIVYNQLVAVKWLFDRGACLPTDPESRNDLLFLVCQRSNFTIAHYLVEKGLRIEPFVLDRLFETTAAVGEALRFLKLAYMLDPCNHIKDMYAALFLRTRTLWTTVAEVFSGNYLKELDHMREAFAAQMVMALHSNQRAFLSQYPVYVLNQILKERQDLGIVDPEFYAEIVQEIRETHNTQAKSIRIDLSVIREFAEDQEIQDGTDAGSVQEQATRWGIHKRKWSGSI